MSQAYFVSVLPAARKASLRTGLPVSVILAQWAIETGYGASRLARQCHNHGGIKFTSHAERLGAYNSNGYACYPSIDHFVEDYVRVLGLPYYDKVRAAATGIYPDHEERVAAVCRALGESPYAQSGYAHGGEPGKLLLLVIAQWRLTVYDDNAQTPGPGRRKPRPRVLVHHLAPDRVQLEFDGPAPPPPQGTLLMLEALVRLALAETELEGLRRQDPAPTGSEG